MHRFCRFVRTALLFLHQDGISAFLKTESCPNLGRPDVSYSGETLSYFLSAEEITWDYGPSGKDRLTDKSLTDADRFVFSVQLVFIILFSQCSNHLLYVLNMIIIYHVVLSLVIIYVVFSVRSLLIMCSQCSHH